MDGTVPRTGAIQVKQGSGAPGSTTRGTVDTNDARDLAIFKSRQEAGEALASHGAQSSEAEFEDIGEPAVSFFLNNTRGLALHEISQKHGPVRKPKIPRN
jgi:hypothetical protein